MSISVFISGGTSGMGAELAKLYAMSGARVGVIGRSYDNFNLHFKDTLNVKFYQVDICDQDKVEEAVIDFAEGGLDIVIASHGIAYAHKSDVPDFDYSRKMVEVNLTGVINLFGPAFLIMKERGIKGRLAALASVAGFNGLPGVSAYSASKAGVLKLCESYAIDFKKWGISVTSISPGFVDTPLTRKNSHPMPFLMDAPKAAKLMAQAIERRKVTYAFPWLFSRVLIALSFLPRSLYVKIFKIRIFDFSVKKDKLL